MEKFPLELSLFLNVSLNSMRITILAIDSAIDCILIVFQPYDGFYQMRATDISKERWNVSKLHDNLKIYSDAKTLLRGK